MIAKRRLSTDDVDFAWAKGVQPHVQAMAAWFEYARDSQRLVERVKALRQAKMFCSEGSDDAVIRRLITPHLRIISLPQIRLLVCSEDFPSKPFVRAKWNPD